MFPKYVNTIAGQLSSKHLSWREYAQDMGNDPHRDGTTTTKQGPTCGHPPIGGTDLTDSTGPANDSYATRHNPFMYFESVIGRPAYCRAHVLSLKPLAGDLSARRDHPELLVRHAQHLRRRPRLAQVPGRDAGPPPARRPVPEGRGSRGS